MKAPKPNGSCFSTDVYIRTPEKSDMGWNLYLAPFSYGLWLAVVMAICALSFCLVLTNCSPGREKGDNSLSVSAVLFYIFGCLCQQGEAAYPIYIFLIMNIIKVHSISFIMFPLLPSHIPLLFG
jgi:hypothetical protein